MSLRFEIKSKDQFARLGRVTTSHGPFDTPAFMPVGTQGTIKGVLPDHVAATGAQIILANTYHLMLRPGEEVVAQLAYLERIGVQGEVFRPDRLHGPILPPAARTA